jgi:hypothetical protein
MRSDGRIGGPGLFIVTQTFCETKLKLNCTIYLSHNLVEQNTKIHLFMKQRFIYLSHNLIKQKTKIHLFMTQFEKQSFDHDIVIIYSLDKEKFESPRVRK